MDDEFPDLLDDLMVGRLQLLLQLRLLLLLLRSFVHLRTADSDCSFSVGVQLFFDFFVSLCGLTPSSARNWVSRAQDGCVVSK